MEPRSKKYAGLRVLRQRLNYNGCLSEKLILDHDVRYYHFVSQAEVIIDGMDDVEEMKNTDVSGTNN